MPTRPPARPPTRLSNDRESSLKAPLLKEFGITPEEYEEYKSAPERYEARVNQAADATAIVAGIIYGLIRHEAGLLAATFAGLAAWMGAWIVAHIIARFIVSLRADSATTRHPAHSRISRYEAAQAQYEAAEAKHEAARLAYQTTLQQYWRSLGSRQFEIALAELYGLMGYKATATQCSRDGGVDILLRRKNSTIIVQCKAHDKPVGPAAVRELYGSLLDCKAKSAVLASVSGFSNSAQEFAAGKPIQLVGLDEIVEMAIEVHPFRDEGQRQNNQTQRKPAQLSKPRR